VQPPFPWPWIALATLLLLAAVAVLLRKTFGIAIGFVGQGLFLLPLLRDTLYGVGSFLFTGMGYDGIDPDYRDLAFTFLALAIAVGPAFTLLLVMSSRRAVVQIRATRIAAVLLAVALGVWFARDWAVASGIVWQVLLALILATLGTALWNDQSQNAWFDHFPGWTSPRQLAYALMVAVPVPTLAALLAARTTRIGTRSGANTLAAARD